MFVHISEILECLKNRHTTGDETFTRVVSESWGKLVEGSYEASNKLVSVKLLNQGLSGLLLFTAP